MSLSDNLTSIARTLHPSVTLCAVSKFQPIEAIAELYECGQRIFGESRPQEFATKAAALADDIEWHFIGHLQTNKVGLVIPAATLIESVDSERLLAAISKEAGRIGRTIDILLQVHIAKEQTKQGFAPDEVRSIIERGDTPNVRIRGLMGMATFTDDTDQVRAEFASLRALYDQIGGFDILSMGMSGDYQLAIECGSTSVRIGTAIFGERVYL